MPAESTTGGIWLARLETAATADDVVDILVAALNVSGGEPALFDRLRRGGSGLVILDNCEQVLDAVAALTIRLLDDVPGLRILCTSQVSLDVDGECVFELAPLPLSDAVALFNRRAAAPRDLEASSGQVDTVRDICRSLDGLPLAIELAAARTKTLSAEEIVRRLDDRFTLLNDPSSRQPERRRSLRSTIGWSYDLLFPDDQRGLWALAVFAGGASLSAVEFVLEALDVPSAAAIDVVSRLADRSLVIVYPERGPTAYAAADPGVTPHDVLRYRLLDSIRAFALEAMADARLSEPALAAHAEWFARAATGSTAGVRSGRQHEHLWFARTERANIDAALAWCLIHRPRLALEIVIGFGWAWVVLGDSRGAQRILTTLEAVGDAGRPEDRANALLLAAWIEASTGQLEPAKTHIASAAECAEETHDVDLTARCLYYLAYVVSHSGEFDHAMELTARSSAIYDGLDRPWIRPQIGCSRPEPRSQPVIRNAALRLAGTRSDGWERWTTRGWRCVATPCSASWPGSNTDSTMPSSTSAAQWKPRGGSASSDGGLSSREPRSSAVPGRRLRRWGGHPGARHQQGRGDR